MLVLISNIPKENRHNSLIIKAKTKNYLKSIGIHNIPNTIFIQNIRLPIYFKYFLKVFNPSRPVYSIKAVTPF